VSVLSLAETRRYIYPGPYESDPIDLVSGGTVVLTPRIGRVTKIWGDLVCKTADVGYQPGDSVPLQFTAGSGASSRGVSAKTAGNNIILRFSNNISLFQVSNGLTGIDSNIVPARWSLKVYGEV
jgi:hypothetical protein